MSHEPEIAFAEMPDDFKVRSEEINRKLSDYYELLRLLGMSEHEWLIDKERLHCMSSQEFLLTLFKKSTVYHPVPKRLLKTLVCLGE